MRVVFGNVTTPKTILAVDFNISIMLDAGLSILRVHGIAAKVHKPGKQPRNSVYDATQDPATIAGWLTAGGNFGATSADGRIITFDVDTRDGGSVEALGNIPPTWTTMSGRGEGGCHLYFKLPEGMSATNNLKFYKGVDTRAKGGFCVIPPSLHPDSKQPYTWAPGRAPSDLPMAELPEHLAMRLRALQEPAPPMDITNISKDDVTDALARIPATGGEHYERWYRVGMVLKDTGWDDAFKIWDAWCQSCPEYYNAWNNKKQWDSYGRRDAGAKVGIGTLFRYAISCGWPGPKMPTPDWEKVKEWADNYPKEDNGRTETEEAPQQEGAPGPKPCGRSPGSAGEAAIV